MQLAASAFQIDLERANDHNLGRTDNVGEVRIDLGIQVLEIDGRNDLPGFRNIGKRLTQYHLDNAAFGHGKFAPFDLGIAASAAKKIVNDGKHQLGIEHQQCRSAQRIELDQIQARGYFQVLRVFAELLNSYRRDADLRRAADHIEESDSELPREPIIDHLERRHAAAHQSYLCRYIVWAYFAGIFRRRGGRHRAIINTLEQVIDFILVENFGAHGYWITKLVKYTASMSLPLPPSLSSTLRMVASVAARSFSLPSTLISVALSWPENSITRSLRTAGSVFLRFSMTAASRPIASTVTCR